MITGANTNIRYRGIVFHVQTEDSGRAYPHIISHLYQGGTILASEKTEYADQVGASDLEGIVRGLIEQQHREMVRRLRGGDFDEVIVERLGPDAMQRSGPLESDTPIPDVAPVEPEPQKITACSSSAPMHRRTISRASSRKRVVWRPVPDDSVCVLAYSGRTTSRM